MSKSTIAVCVVCGASFGSKQKAGEISIKLSIKGGPFMLVSGPVCPVCAAKSAAGPDVTLEQMRAARTHLLVDAIGARS